VQTPLSHDLPAEHVVPQEPQFVASVWVSTQTPPHADSPGQSVVCVPSVPLDEHPARRTKLSQHRLNPRCVM
jgi:hypothetical protein